jgi:hypothetical protein
MESGMESEWTGHGDCYDSTPPQAAWTLLLHRARECGFMSTSNSTWVPLDTLMRCDITMNEQAGTRIAASAPSHACARSLAICLLLLTSP